MSLGEFEIINKYFTRKTSRSDIILGVGDDCAILRIPNNMELAVTIDTLISGVHFPVQTAPYAIGWKSLAVSLSDLAAMGAEPAWITLALTLPEVNEDWLHDFSKGLFDLAAQYNVALVGGDTTRGHLAITIEAHGFVPYGQFLGRNGAQPDDLIYITGTLGDAALGLEICENRLTTIINETDNTYLINRLNFPQPRIAAGLALRGIANAAIDISDGLISDLGHILNNSNVGAIVYLENLPRSSALKNLTCSWEKIISGGDDYELCFTIPSAHQAQLEQILTTINCNFTLIGVIKKSLGITWYDINNNIVNFDVTGFCHF